MNPKYPASPSISTYPSPSEPRLPVRDNHHQDQIRYVQEHESDMLDLVGRHLWRDNQLATLSSLMLTCKAVHNLLAKHLYDTVTITSTNAPAVFAGLSLSAEEQEYDVDWTTILGAYMRGRKPWDLPQWVTELATGLSSNSSSGSPHPCPCGLTGCSSTEAGPSTLHQPSPSPGGPVAPGTSSSASINSVSKASGSLVNQASMRAFSNPHPVVVSPTSSSCLACGCGHRRRLFGRHLKEWYISHTRRVYVHSIPNPSSSAGLYRWAAEFQDPEKERHFAFDRAACVILGEAAMFQLIAYEVCNTLRKRSALHPFLSVLSIAVSPEDVCMTTFPGSEAYYRLFQYVAPYLLQSVKYRTLRDLEWLYKRNEAAQKLMNWFALLWLPKTIALHNVAYFPITVIRAGRIRVFLANGDSRLLRAHLAVILTMSKAGKGDQGQDPFVVPQFELVDYRQLHPTDVKFCQSICKAMDLRIDPAQGIFFNTREIAPACVCCGGK